MTRREQIIEILKSYGEYHYLPEIERAYVIGDYSFEDVADAILALNNESKLRVESFERENQYVTDEDIQAWALKRVIIDMQPKSRINTASENAYKRGLIEAATAMRDGKITPVSRDNDR